MCNVRSDHYRNLPQQVLRNKTLFFRNSLTSVDASLFSLRCTQFAPAFASIRPQRYVKIRFINPNEKHNTVFENLLHWVTGHPKKCTIRSVITAKILVVHHFFSAKQILVHFSFADFSFFFSFSSPRRRNL